MSANTRTFGAALEDLDKFVTELREKQAAELPLGGDQGDKDTTHPSTTVDNQEQAATEGARSAENEADISKDVPGVNINDVPAADANKPAAMENLTTAEDTGDDPSNETSGVKFDKDDPGTAHPAEMDGTENGKSASINEMIEQSIAQFGVEKTAAEMLKLVQGELHPGTQAAKQAAEAGAADADALVREIEQNVPTVLDNLDKMAAAYASNLYDYYAGIEAQHALNKQAEGEEIPEEPMPGEAGGEGALPEEDIAQLAAAAGGEPEAEGELPPMPEEMAGGEDEAVIEALSEALGEAGITPEELVAAVEAEQAGAGPEMPIEEKMAQVKVAHAACREVNAYRNLVAAGRIREKRASLEQKFAMYQMVRKLTEKK